MRLGCRAAGSLGRAGDFSRETQNPPMEAGDGVASAQSPTRQQTRTLSRVEATG